MLQEGAGVAQHGVAQFAQLGDQRARRNDVAQAQRGRQAFGHRAHVNHPPHFVQAFERRHGLALVQVFGFVVVFNHHKIFALRQRQQSGAPLHAQGVGGGALVRGGDKTIIQVRQVVHDQALRVDRQRHKLRCPQRKAVARVRVARFLQAHALLRIKQGLGQQVIGVLRAHGDQNLFGQREHAALGQQAQADLLNDLGHIAELKVRRPLRQVRARQTVYAALPKSLGRKKQRVVGAINKGVAVLAPLVGLGQGALFHQRTHNPGVPIGLGPLGARALGGTGQVRTLGRVLRHVQTAGRLHHKHAAARARFQKTIVHQLGISGCHGVAAQAQQHGQFARRWERRASGKAPVQNRLHHRQTKALLQRQCGFVGQGEQGFPLRALGTGLGGHGASIGTGPWGAQRLAQANGGNWLFQAPAGLPMLGPSAFGELPMTAAITVATLEAFSAAWNRHDIDALMSFMHPDCVFLTAAGDQACGTRHSGTDAVRKAFAGAWTTVPDVQWTKGKHFVHGDFGVSEWTFEGTAADGSRIETDGVDLFTFKDGKILVKNVFRKARPNIPAAK